MKTLPAIVLLCLPAVAILPASAQVTETLKLAAPDAAADDAFGTAVAVFGTTAIVGTPRDDDAGTDSGSASVFDAVTGQQLFKLTGSDSVTFDQFGRSVAISGTTAIVGAPFHDTVVGVASGAAYLFDTTTGQQLFKLIPSDAGAPDWFGWSVAISGTTAIVGAHRNSDAGSESGSAYLFDTTTGQELFKLTASDAAEFDRFGYSVAIAGTTAIVGAYTEDGVGSASGAVYVFDTTTGQEVFKLTAADAAQSDFFGFSVAISGSTAIIGAYGDNDAGANSGSAYLFDTTTGQQFFKLTASDAAMGDDFGFSVALAGTTAIVGTHKDDDGGMDSGSAYVFDTTTGQQLFKLTASDAAAEDFFGTSVAISGAAAIVGAIGADAAGVDSGSAYVLIRPPEIISQPQSVIVSPGETAVFSVGVTSPGARDFRWRRDGVNLSNGGNITGARSATLQIIAQPGDAAVYDCVIDNPVPVVSDAVILSVRADPNACPGDIADEFGTLGFLDDQISFGDFLALLGLIGPCP